MTKRSQQINKIVKKIATIAEEDLNKVEAFVDELNGNKNENSVKKNNRLRTTDFSFAKARKITTKLNSALADEIISERALEQ